MSKSQSQTWTPTYLTKHNLIVNRPSFPIMAKTVQSLQEITANGINISNIVL